MCAAKSDAHQERQEKKKRAPKSLTIAAT